MRQELSVQQAKNILQDTVSYKMFEALFAAPARFWLIDGEVYFDDPEFGEIVACSRLDYSPDLGLFVKEI